MAGVPSTLSSTISPNSVSLVAMSAPVAQTRVFADAAEPRSNSPQRRHAKSAAYAPTTIKVIAYHASQTAFVVPIKIGA